MGSVKTPPRQRRAPGEARELLLNAAKQLFSDQGYGATSTREIADHAGVAEPLLFRHFGSKAVLFSEAMLEPYRAFLDEYMTQWEDDLRHPEGIQEVTKRFVDGLLGLMRTHRKTFRALVAVSAFEPPTGVDAGSAESEFSRQLDRFGDYMRQSGAVVPKKMNPDVSTRLLVGTVFAATVLETWLFAPSPDHPSEQQIDDELRQFVLYGVLGKRP
ncbi:MAG: TetR/AcrR family transcriptional regulator [Acidimicrobiia bacterium]